MPKFGQVHYNEGYYGDSHIAKGDYKRSIKRIPLGVQVRKQFGKRVIFRVRRGNGFYDSILGKLYQDKYKYVVPSSINNAEGEPSRTQLRAAVDYWQGVLSEEEKSAYNVRATKGLRMGGYHLFMREAMNGDYPMFVDRGDPASFDFDKEDLTLDGAWHDLDLSGIVPSVARAILICGHIQGNAVDWRVIFRKNGNTNEVNHCGMETLRANVERHRTSVVAIGSDKIIEYKADNQAWATLSLAIRGWWTGG